MEEDEEEGKREMMRERARCKWGVAGCSSRAKPLFQLGTSITMCPGLPAVDENSKRRGEPGGGTIEGVCGGRRVLKAGRREGGYRVCDRERETGRTASSMPCGCSPPAIGDSHCV